MPEGRYLYEVDGRTFYVSAGDLVSVLGGAAHPFTNVSERPSSQLVLMLPAMDAAAFFGELESLMAAGRPDMPALNAFGGPSDVEFLEPPIHGQPTLGPTINSEIDRRGYCVIVVVRVSLALR